MPDEELMTLILHLYQYLLNLFFQNIQLRKRKGHEVDLLSAGSHDEPSKKIRFLVQLTMDVSL